jgi:PST family polysaccharide transporter
MFLGIGVVLTVMANSNLVLIQGLRLIVNLGKINIASAVIGTSLGLLFVLTWGTYGIVPMLLTIPTVNLACSLWITRKIPYQDYIWFCKPRLSEIHDLIRLGLSFMISVLLANGVGLLLRILIIKEIGITAAGNFAAAYSLAGVYTGFILQAMAADFYPRLAANNKDRDLTNRLVNEQTEIALDLALPGILGTIVFAPWVVNALYTDSFHGAAEVLQWQVVGMFGRIVTWPIGFILIAKGESFAFIVTESVSCLVYLFSAWAGLKLFGLMGVGIAFIVLYVFYAVMMLLVSKQLTGFKWSVCNRNRLFWMLPTIVIVMVVTFLVSRPWSIMVGSLSVVVSAGICCRSLLKFGPENVFKRT